MGSGSSKPNETEKETTVDAQYVRTIYQGVSRYFAINSGKSRVHPERISIVQKRLWSEDANSYLLQPAYKLCYVVDGQPSLKLSLQQVSDETPKSGRPSFVLKCCVAARDDAERFLVGDLEQNYPHELAGQVLMWTNDAGDEEGGWIYENFWGLPIGRPLIDDEEPLPEIVSGKAFFVNGSGHKIGSELTRTMVYSTDEDNPATSRVIIRSSDLRVIRCDVSPEPFELFYRPRA